MSRPIFDTNKIAPAVLEQINTQQTSVVKEVENAIGSNKIVVVGMKGNPHCKKAVNALNKAKLNHCYLEYGSYLSEWKKRLNLKIWLGWKTFPMVFVKGEFIGGAAELVSYLKNNDLSDL
jgi:glutaredoxin-related protein